MDERTGNSYFALLKEVTCESENVVAMNGAENPSSSITPAEAYNHIPCYGDWIKPKRPSIP